MDWLTIFVALVVGLTAFYSYLRSSRSRRKNVPPGPRGIPVLGNLLSLAAVPHLTFLRWKEQYGDIYLMYDGRKPMVILNNYDTIKKVFYDDASAGRDHATVMPYEGATKHSGLGLLFSEGNLWKVHRRFAFSALRDLGVGKNWMEDIILHEVKDLCETLRNTNGQPFNPKIPLTNSVSNVICALIFGRRFELTDPRITRLTTMISERIDCMAVDSLTQAIPALMWFPNPVRNKILQGRQDIKEQEDFFKNLVANHSASISEQGNAPDYLHAYQMEKDKEGFGGLTAEECSDHQLLGSLGDLFAAGSETTSTTTLWTFVYMLENPHMLSKAQKEIDAKIGRENVITSAERGLLPYTEAIIYEVLRISSLVPIHLHKAREDMTIDGYTIPKETIIGGNFYSVHHDSRWWKDPEVFDPCRFLDENGKLVRHDHFAPFGIGKRACIGESLAKMELFLFIANLFRCLDISLPPGKRISRHDYSSSLVVQPLPFELIFTSRIDLWPDVIRYQTRTSVFRPSSMGPLRATPA